MIAWGPTNFANILLLFIYVSEGFVRCRSESMIVDISLHRGLKVNVRLSRAKESSRASDPLFSIIAR